MSDWQVGDLALCVDARPEDWVQDVIVEQGRVYRVIGITATRGTSRPALLLEGVTHNGRHGVYVQSRFRKIRPDKHEDCEPEFVTLLKRSERKVPA